MNTQDIKPGMVFLRLPQADQGNAYRMGWRVAAVDAFKGFPHAWVERIETDSGTVLPSSFQYGWIPCHALIMDYELKQ